MTDDKKAKPVLDTEVEFIRECTYAGKKVESGFKTKVTKERAASLKARELVK